MRRFVKEEAYQERVVKFEILIFHPFDILPHFITKCVLARKVANKLPPMI
jgi:hypothetical protein